MVHYYYETRNTSGSFVAENDKTAKEYVANIKNLLVLYKESDSNDGRPYIVVLDGEE